MYKISILLTSFLLVGCTTTYKNKVLEEYEYSDGTIIYVENVKAKKSEPKKFYAGDKVLYYVEYEDEVPFDYTLKRAACETAQLPISVVGYVLPYRKDGKKILPIKYVY